MAAPMLWAPAVLPVLPDLLALLAVLAAAAVAAVAVRRLLAVVADWPPNLIPRAYGPALAYDPGHWLHGTAPPLLPAHAATSSENASSGTGASSGTSSGTGSGTESTARTGNPAAAFKFNDALPPPQHSPRPTVSTRPEDAFKDALPQPQRSPSFASLSTRPAAVPDPAPFPVTAVALLDRRGVDSLVVRRLGFPVLVTRDAALIRRVLVTHCDLYAKPEGLMSGYREMRPIMGDGLVLSKGERWKAHRRIANPAFAPAYLRSLVPAFAAVGAHLARVLEDAARARRGSPVDLALEVGKATVDIIGETGFGVQFGCLDDSAAKLPQAIFGTLEQQRKIFREPLAPLLDRAGMRQYYDGIRILRDLAQSVIDRRRRPEADTDKGKGVGKGGKTEPGEGGEEDGGSGANGDGDRRKSLLAHLLASQTADLQAGLAVPTMTDADLIDQTMTFLLAGHETTATVVVAALNLLLRHPEVLAKVEAELDDVLPNREDSDGMTFDTVQQLSYLDLVLKETMRVAPSISGVGRSPTADDVLDDGTVIPKGARVVVSMHALHHNRRYWGADADRFVPERWLEDSTLATAQYAYMPFVAGPRNCIGHLFAHLEMRVLLAQLVRRFRFALAFPPGTEDPTIARGGPWTVRARDPLLVLVARR